MNIFRIFGLGKRRILAQNRCVPGTVTGVRTSLLHVVKKPVRLYPNSGNTLYSHYITFTYTADGIPCKGILYVDVTRRCPQTGETVTVYYDPEKPKNYACLPFGPGVKPIGW